MQDNFGIQRAPQAICCNDQLGRYSPEANLTELRNVSKGNVCRKVCDITSPLRYNLAAGNPAKCLLLKDLLSISSFAQVDKKGTKPRKPILGGQRGWLSAPSNSRMQKIHHGDEIKHRQP